MSFRSRLITAQIFVVWLACLFSPVRAYAEAELTPRSTPRGHGPDAHDHQFLSHRFQLAAHAPERPQLAFHFGLLQPILLRGFNAALDVRYKRLVVTYSHGQGLDVTRFLSVRERAAGLELREPWTTGGGIGVTLIDELWLLADFKVHRFEAEVEAEQRSYTTVTVGAELGYRLFIWRGLNLALVARYWPNVYASSGRGALMHDKNGERFLHKPMQQGSAGFFVNVLVGWAFNL